MAKKKPRKAAEPVELACGEPVLCFDPGWPDTVTPFPGVVIRPQTVNGDELAHASVALFSDGSNNLAAGCHTWPDVPVHPAGTVPSPAPGPYATELPGEE